MQLSGELLAFFFLNIMVGWLGVNALAVQQIVWQCNLMVLMIPIGGAQACTILVAQALGAGDTLAVKKIGLAGLLLITSLIAMVSALYLFKPYLIIGLFLNVQDASNMQIMHLAVVILAIAAFSQVADGIRNLTLGVLRGIKDIWLPMWLNVCALFLFSLPLAYILGFTLNFGLRGLSSGFLIGFIGAAILMLWRVWSKMKYGLGLPNPI